MKNKLLFLFLMAGIIFTSCNKEEWDVAPDDSLMTMDENGLKVSQVDENCVVDLVAGQTIPVGEVQVSNDGTYFHVSYVITNTQWEIVDIHLALSTDSPGTGEWISKRWQNRKGNPAPGKFPYKYEDGTLSNGVWSISIPLEDIGPDGAEPGDFVCIGAHAVVRKTTGSGAGGTETAWGSGTRFVKKGNWGMYFCCEVDPDPGPPPVIIFGATTVGENGERALYEINLTTQVETLIFVVPQSGDQFSPNGLAFDEANNRLYYAMGNQLWFYDRANDDNIVAGSINPISYGSVFAGGKYWYVRNGTNDLYAISFDANGLISGGADTPFDPDFSPFALAFGDISYDAATNTIYGSSTATGGGNPPLFFKYEFDKDPGERFTNLGTNGASMQLALVFDGTLIGHRTVEKEYYTLDKTGINAPSLLFTGLFSYNDLAPGPQP